MMQLAIPQVRCEIFRKPVFWDDNFVSWEAVAIWNSIFSTDGDVATVEVATGETEAAMQIPVVAPFYVHTHKYAIIKVDRLDNTPLQLYIRQSSTGDWNWAANIFSTGIAVIDLSGDSEDKHYGIRLRLTNATPGDKFEVDYITICEKTMLIPSDTWDLLTEMQITLPLLTSGIPGVNPLKFPNFNAEYTGLISPFDVILLYLWRKGDSMKKVFGGRIVQPGTTGSGSTQEYYVICEAVGHGQALQAPENLLQKRYEATNGRTIIKDALACCSAVTDKFVDVDEEIESTHDFDFAKVGKEALPYDIINEVCREAKTLGGVVGFDPYVDPAANLDVFKRGKYVSPASLTEAEIDTYTKEADALRLRNRVRVYGAATKPYPEDHDEWTESLVEVGEWISDGSRAVVTDKVIGNYAIRGQKFSASAVYLQYEFPHSINMISDHIEKIHFWIKVTASTGSLEKIVVGFWKDDMANRWWREKRGAIQMNKWVEVEMPVGPDADYYKFGEGEQPWDDIRYMYVNFVNSEIADIAIYIDGLYFKKHWEATVEDKVSQAKYYDVRCREPEVDEKLLSDAECEARARSLCEFLSQPVTKFTMTVEGDNRYRPGDKLRVQLSNDQIDDWFRIVEVRHVVRGVEWDTYLTLSNEPEMIDYVFAMTGPARKAGATVVVGKTEGKDVDSTSIQQAIDLVTA